MKMHVLSGGRLRMRKSVYLPTVDPAETIELPVSCFLLRHEKGNVLFDTGCQPTTPEEGAARWGKMVRVMTPVGEPGQTVLSELSALGLQPSDIDVVVNSHLHSDHCGCNEFFKKATLICHAKELAAARKEDAVANGFIPADWETPTPYSTFEAQRDLFSDGRVVLLPLPGHTPGMSGALVSLDRDGSFLLVSDAIPLRANLEQEITPRNTWDAKRSEASAAEIKMLQKGGAQVLFGHDDEQWKTLRKGQDAYE